MSSNRLSQEQDAYEILGVGEWEGDAIIKETYTRLMAEHEERLKAVKQAYQKISNPRKRAQYDEKHKPAPWEDIDPVERSLQMWETTSNPRRLNPRSTKTTTTNKKTTAKTAPTTRTPPTQSTATRRPVTASSRNPLYTRPPPPERMYESESEFDYLNPIYPFSCQIPPNESTPILPDYTGMAVWVPENYHETGVFVYHPGPVHWDDYETADDVDMFWRDGTDWDPTDWSDLL